MYLFVCLCMSISISIHACIRVFVCVYTSIIHLWDLKLQRLSASRGWGRSQDEP